LPEPAPKELKARKAPIKLKLKETLKRKIYAALRRLSQAVSGVWLLAFEAKFDKSE
jgi:hypothetical protein